MTRIALVAAASLLIALNAAHSRQAADAIAATGTIEYAFTPGSDATGLIVRTLAAARAEVYVQAFSFTHKDIAQALIAAHRRGVKVQVIADASQTDLIEHNVLPLLARAGLRVLLDAEHASAHNKTIVVDPGSEQPAVVTGSFNFTFAAQYKNAENVLVLRGNRELTRAYLDNWRRHSGHSQTYGAH
jgi:phosphatidylserine/phosphatidylglycerophosphate/cardiolipin synthase-like enzyme